MTWRAYVLKRGPLNDGLRSEYLFARLSTHIAHVAGNEKAKLSDYLRYYEVDAEEETILDIGEAAKLLGVKRIEQDGK